MTIQIKSGSESSATASRWPRTGHMTSSQVTKTFPPITPHRKKVEPREVSLCFSCSDPLAYVQHELPASFIRSGHLTWHKAILSNRTFGVNMHMFRCVWTRGARWCFVFVLYLSYFEAICKKKRWSCKKQYSLFDLSWEGQNVTKVVKLVIVRCKTSNTFRSSFCKTLLQLADKRAFPPCAV